ncbi:hypothetical protein [Aurantiacibacter poecillastricola]|uniref:hypothetical protein n=1 Tax=Aurantiacibacter poecillastricola TaxID=3064385 RepID=UPI00273EB335|nr:hypothetical protein [Aurantiacibacter sp. 219JJ12-13]MDP5262571.1 hypothetical protein [Aurantiacibacter sp. 219JJ12-13]
MTKLYRTTTLVALLALPSCGGSESEMLPGDETLAVEDHLRSAMLGPLTYRFDDAYLTPADVEITIPPEYDDVHLGTKLIPADRADDLGDFECEYGESGLVSECTAQQETGLTLALLPRPLDEYRTAFTQDLSAEEVLEDARLDGANGFSFTAQAEGEGIEYQFFAIEGRTLLLARGFDGETARPTNEALEEVIDTLEQSVEMHLEEAA